MLRLAQLTKHFGATVAVDNVTIDILPGQMVGVIGMAQGQVVFDGPPVALTSALLGEIYGTDEGGEDPHEAMGSPGMLRMGDQGIALLPAGR